MEDEPLFAERVAGIDIGKAIKAEAEQTRADADEQARTLVSRARQGGRETLTTANAASSPSGTFSPAEPAEDRLVRTLSPGAIGWPSVSSP